MSGLKAADVQIAVVLHGEATKSALNDTFYAARFDMGGNPNLRLVHELQLAGVEVYVCSQALNYKGFSESAVAKGISVADAALTVVMNKQAEGYAYVLIP